MSKRNSHTEIVEEALSRPEVKREYDALTEEFELLRDQMNIARKGNGQSD